MLTGCEKLWKLLIEKNMKDSLFMNNSTKPMMIQGLCFSLCFFAFQITEFTVNDRAEILFGAKWVNTVYSVGIACTALGFLSFSWLRRLFAGERKRKVIICIVGLISILTSVALLTINSKVLFLLCSFLALLSYGHIGGKIYYSVSMTFSGNDYTGRFIGIGMGCAVLLQFVVQNLFVTNVAFIASIVISAAVLVYFVIKPPKDWMFENPLPYSSENKTDKKEVSILIVATILMSLVIGLIDGVVVAKHAEGSLSVSSYARLFYALSLPVAGFVADIKNRKYLSIVTVCTLFISTISTALMSASGTFFWATAFMYVYSGFYVMFLTISFIDLAPRTKRPELWASMGRVIRSLTTAFTAIPVVGLFEQFGSIALVAGSCILSVMTLLVLFRSISFSILPQESAKETSDDASAPLTREEVIQAYAKHYGFTPRESEVFEKLISTEDGTQQIADSLYISRRVLQRYIAAIYEKTDTKSRIGLFQNFIAFNK